MIWINKDNTKPLYLLSVENILLDAYSENIEITKTNEIIQLSVNGNVASLIKKTKNDFEIDIEQEPIQLLGAKIIYECDKPNLFAISVNDNKIISNDKKILLDIIRTILTRIERSLLKLIMKYSTSEEMRKLCVETIKKAHKTFKIMHEKIKEI